MEEGAESTQEDLDQNIVAAARDIVHIAANGGGPREAMIDRSTYADSGYDSWTRAWQALVRAVMRQKPSLKEDMGDKEDEDG